ncbi:glycosyltransferase involved in cell wall biosynthesis [Rhodococcus sp. 27YEA15]|uniref:glycosyltransferase family 2 protein n=1 Tax=Rhodococcus sp. 27YEA15 TaxID=3156259 RepID=UPI003C7B28C3
MVASTLSIVVPVFNEEAYIEPCLDALLAQEDSIAEIVVVDNNSTDGTAAILQRYADRSHKVRIVEEKTAGVVHARNAGFDASTGEFIGRIDADTIVSPGWAASVVDYLCSHREIAGMNGLSYLYESPIANHRRRSIDRRISTGKLLDGQSTQMMQGNNMAIRRAAWSQVRELVSDSDQFHEDVDLTMCFVDEGLPIVQSLTMRAHISGRRGQSSPVEYAKYCLASRATFARHGLKSSVLDILLGINGLMHVALWPLHRAYDAESNRISIRNLWRSPAARSLPFAAAS